MQIVLPLLACVISKKVFERSLLFIVSDVGFYKVRDTYMENFYIWKYNF